MHHASRVKARAMGAAFGVDASPADLHRDALRDPPSVNLVSVYQDPLRADSARGPCFNNSLWRAGRMMNLFISMKRHSILLDSASTQATFSCRLPRELNFTRGAQWRCRVWDPGAMIW